MPYATTRVTSIWIAHPTQSLASIENTKYGVSFQLRIFFCSTYDKAKAKVVHVETWLGKEK